jgi:hypothetical protein
VFKVEENKSELYKALFKLKSLIRAGAGQKQLLKAVNNVMPLEKGQYYNIYHLIKEPIGKCSWDGAIDELAADSGLKFERISKKEFDKEME